MQELPDGSPYATGRACRVRVTSASAPLERLIVVARRTCRSRQPSRYRVEGSVHNSSNRCGVSTTWRTHRQRFIACVFGRRASTPPSSSYLQMEGLRFPDRQGQRRQRLRLRQIRFDSICAPNSIPTSASVHASHCNRHDLLQLCSRMRGRSRKHSQRTSMQGVFKRCGRFSVPGGTMPASRADKG
jgi:hypothetical protein